MKSDCPGGAKKKQNSFVSKFFSAASVPAENPSEPFGASVIIDGVTYGTGTASSKKLAKNKAGKWAYLQLVNDISCVT